MRMSKNLIIAIAILTLPFLFSCNTTKNTATSGNLIIAADETLKPIVSEWLLTFLALYPSAKIDVKYYPETTLFNNFIKDSVSMIISCRKLNQKEINSVEKYHSHPEETKLAYEGIAVVVNPQNKDMNINYETISDLLNGKVTKINEILPSSKNTNALKIIFDNNGSSVFRYFQDTFQLKSGNSNISVVNSSQELISTITNHRNCIGFLNLAWISRGDAAESQSFLSGLQVLRISHPKFLGGDNSFYEPYSANLAEQIYPPHYYDKATDTYKMIGDTSYTYPFYRTIYAVSSEGRAGLATGFASFIAGESGQKIALKSGLLPATMPTRAVNITQ